MNVKKILLGASAALGLMALTACGTPVPAGHVGIKINKFGGDKGVQTQVVQPGHYWLGFNEELYKFATFNETVQFCDQDKDGSSFVQFQTNDGAIVKVCIAVDYQADETLVPTLFETYRGQALGSGDDTPLDRVVRTFVKRRLTDEMNQEAGTAARQVTDALTGQVKNVKGYSAFEMLSERVAVLTEVQKRLESEFSPVGLRINSLSYTSALVYPDAIQAQINATLESVQKAQRAEADLKTSMAQAKVLVVEAQANADSTRIRAEAIANAPKLLEQMAIEKWNGVLPTYMAGNGPVPFISIPKN